MTDGPSQTPPLNPYALPPESTSGTGLAEPRTSPDPMSVTGAWYVVRGKYGGRKPKPADPVKGQPYQPGDKPLVWVVAYHVGGKVLGVVLTLAALWVAKVLGLDLEILMKLLGGP